MYPLRCSRSRLPSAGVRFVTTMVRQHDSQDGRTGRIRTVVCDDGGRTRSDWIRMEEIANTDGGRGISAVSFAGSGKEALYQASRPRRDPVDVILIDLVMPARASERQRIVAPWIARALCQGNPGEQHPGPPALILWTSNPMKKMGCETHAFIHLGGHQVIDKEDAPDQQVAQLRTFANPLSVRSGSLHQTP